MKNTLILILLCFLLPFHASGGSYTVGTKCEFTPYYFDGEYFLIMSYSDVDSCNLIGNVVLRFRMNDGTDLVFKGEQATSTFKSSSSGSSIGKYSFSSGSTKETHYVIFPISKEQIEMLEKGVDKVAINTIPVIYYRDKWAGKKSFGKNLNKDFKELKDVFDTEHKPAEWE